MIDPPGFRVVRASLGPQCSLDDLSARARELKDIARESGRVVLLACQRPERAAGRDRAVDVDLCYTEAPFLVPQTRGGVAPTRLR